MSILDKAREAAAAAAEKTRELASSAVAVVEEAGVKAKELAQEAGAAVADGVSTTVEKARDLARALAAQLPTPRLSIVPGSWAWKNESRRLRKPGTLSPPLNPRKAEASAAEAEPGYGHCGVWGCRCARDEQGSTGPASGGWDPPRGTANRCGCPRAS